MTTETDEDRKHVRDKADKAFPCTYRGALVRIEQRKRCGGRTTPEGVFVCDSPAHRGQEVSAERVTVLQRKNEICRFCTVYQLPEGTTGADSIARTQTSQQVRSRNLNDGFRGDRADLRNERIAAIELTPAAEPSQEEKRRYTDSRGVTWTLPALTPEAFRALAVEIDSHIMPRQIAKCWIPEEKVWKLRALLLIRRLVRAEGESRGLTEKDWQAGIGPTKAEAAAAVAARSRAKKGEMPCTATPVATLRAFEALRYVCCTDGSQELDCPTLKCARRLRFEKCGGRPGPISRRKTRPTQNT